ncbi:hypothetical protein CERSUDRAFT_113956 [Gelatoporia subvermispora B]|uniref:VanZ-like domain-containing protein n=1 Tax=Ceriporiopsis subvermispora (strain B) TaxID=914234 RepID=M2REQ2_CERS8|nr:hypothetical protein CERSUDRAFT_113956 [Gelatoporia subvermispora B]
MLGLPTSHGDSQEPAWKRAGRSVRKTMRRTSKAIMRSHKFRIPKYDMPLRLRPWFLLFTTLIMILLAFLGFTNVAHALPLNDKLLHFLCLSVATGVFYFIFDVEEDARRIWFWRSAPLIFTGVTCFLLGGIVSEFVQSMLPYKQFQFGDVVANLLGSTLGLYIAYYLEKYYRHRREISRLYQPLDTDSAASDDEDDMGGTQLLPTHFQPGSSRAASKKGSTPKTDAGRIRLSDVWDEREELFDIGADSEDEHEEEHSHTTGPTPETPKIVVTPGSA